MAIIFHGLLENWEDTLLDKNRRDAVKIRVNAIWPSPWPSRLRIGGKELETFLYK